MILHYCEVNRILMRSGRVLCTHPLGGLKLVEGTPGAAVLFVRKTEKGEEAVESKGFPKSGPRAPGKPGP
jgi:hypothetical protein